MTDLPVLKIGCRKKMTAVGALGVAYVAVCGENCFCDDCQLLKDKVLPVVLAHATAHHEELKRYEHSPFRIRQAELEGALAAVLALAGKKTIEELEGK